MNPLDGSYTATVTVTEQYFSGTVENIPVGQNVRELSSSTDRGNSGLNQNYFTQASVGTQSGPAGFGQPTSFTSPSGSAAAHQTFTVTATVTETYVLGNSYMSHPAWVTIHPPSSGCTPPPGCPAGQTLKGGVCVPPTSCPSGQVLSGGVCVPPTGCPSGQVLANGVCVPPTSCPSGQVLANGQCVPPSGCPSGEVLSGGQCVPPSGCPAGEVLSGGQCVPPSGCPAGEVLSGGQCVPPSACPADEILTGSVCAARTVLPAAPAFPAVCRASTRGFKLRAGQVDTIVVSVTRHGAKVSGARVRIALPGNKHLTRSTGKNGKATFTVEPARTGTILVRSPSCKEMVKVKVYAAKAATVKRAPSFTG
ncbi:MAG TPA: EB domain-containing protein [Solirubrobacteraceae bacterium]|nr:EB domain-containing protein [Solirubrobacteraceae bacterium]